MSRNEASQETIKCDYPECPRDADLEVTLPLATLIPWLRGVAVICLCGRHYASEASVGSKTWPAFGDLSTTVQLLPKRKEGEDEPR